MKTSVTHETINDKVLSEVAVKLFLRICDEWQLSEDQCCTLAGLSRSSTLHYWRKKLAAKDSINLSESTLERLSYLAGIYKSIQQLFPDASQWKNWIRKPNGDFGGQSALDHMLSGHVTDLSDVRRYLDGWRGEHYI